MQACSAKRRVRRAPPRGTFANFPSTKSKRKRQMLALATAAACALAVSSPTPRLDAHAALAPVSVLRAATGERVRLTEEWSSDERAVVVLMRSFG